MWLVVGFGGKKPSFSGLQVSDDEHRASGASRRVTSSFCYAASWRLSPHRAAVGIALVCLWGCLRENRRKLFTQSWLYVAREAATITWFVRDSKAGRGVREIQRSKKEGFRCILAGGCWCGKAGGGNQKGTSYQFVRGTYLASSGWSQVGSRDQMKLLFIKSWAFWTECCRVIIWLWLSRGTAGGFLGCLLWMRGWLPGQLQQVREQSSAFTCNLAFVCLYMQSLKCLDTVPSF